MRASFCARAALLGVMIGMVLAGCQSPATGGAESPDTSSKAKNSVTNRLSVLPDESDWTLISATADGLDRPEAKAVQLHIAPTRLSGTSGCNQFSAGYQIVDGQLIVGSPAATKMGCPGPVGEVEQALFTLLPQLSSASMDGADLILQSESGASLRFSSATPASE